MAKTAVLVDGGYYRKRAQSLWGVKSPEDRAQELINYVFRHLNKQDGRELRSLYRIFYYDCPPLDTTLYHPLKQQNVNFSGSETYKFANEFFAELKKKRKVALRQGRLAKNGANFVLSQDKVKRLCSGAITISELKEEDFRVSFTQKGVDMKLGLDISSIAYEGLADQIILIAGDSDFVPAAKMARRKGIDFILDPMGNQVSPDLLEHIDGLESFIDRDPQRVRDSIKKDGDLRD